MQGDDEPGSAPGAPSAPAPRRTKDAARTMADILAAATREFADKGFSGARIDAIAAATATRKYMIYYHFGSKEALYLAVLEDVYRGIREAEKGLHLDELPPAEALAQLVGFAFDYHHGHPDFVRLVMAENINKGEYLARSDVIRELNQSVIHAVRELYRRGVRQGVFRDGLDPVDIHLSISALCFHYVSNRPTFSLIFQSGEAPGDAVQKRRASVIELVLRYVVAAQPPAPGLQ